MTEKQFTIKKENGKCYIDFLNNGKYHFIYNANSNQPYIKLLHRKWYLDDYMIEDLHKVMVA